MFIHFQLSTVRRDHQLPVLVGPSGPTPRVLQLARSKGSKALGLGQLARLAALSKLDYIFLVR